MTPVSLNKGQRFSSLAPAETTHVYDSYWMFAAERQSIFFERVAGNPPPWTRDPVLAKHRFTNAYRASDRVSQYLIQKVIYKDTTLTQEDVFFRIILFKIFNKIRTWEILEKHLGEIHYEDYSYAEYDRIITREMEKGNSVFSAAYIMPSGSRAFGNAKKHRNYLKLLEKMMNEDVPKKVSDARRMRDAFDILLSYPSIGEFLAYQFVTDLNYSCLTNFSEMEFVMPGPGARSGIRKCFKTMGGLSEMEIIQLVAERQEEEFEKRNIDFQSLWGRPLQLIDCQNLFCEVDKYARVVHPDVQGIGKRSRIKQKYSYEAKSQLPYWYPPKWGINEAIQELEENVDGD